MNTRYSTTELIEGYLNGDLNFSQRRMVEERLATDPAFKTALAEHGQLLKAFKVYGKRNTLRQKLNRIHDTITAEKPAIGSPATIKRTPMQLFLRSHYPTIAVAATVAIVTVFGTLFSVDLWRSAKQQQNAHYTALRRDLDKIKKSQSAIMKDINVTGKTGPAYAPGKFSGTGFALTSNGYVVTSYHVIKDAQNIVIENNKGARFTVKEVYKDLDVDLAILKVEDPVFTSFGRLPYGFKKNESDLGEKVFTLGYPREDIVFGEGSISSRSGFLGDTTAYQVSIPLNPGNSGGPLLDDKGNLIGIISGKQMESDGAAFAVKSNYLLQLASQIENDSLDDYLRSSERKNNGRSRSQQLKKMQDFVFVVKVLN
jgi:serine protease Do